MARRLFASGRRRVQMGHLRAEPLSIGGVYRESHLKLTKQSDSASCVLMEPLKPRNKLDLLRNLLPSGGYPPFRSSQMFQY